MLRRAVAVGVGASDATLARLMDENSARWRMRYYGVSRFDTCRSVLAALTADTIVAFGGPAPNAAIVEIARRRNIPIIVVWHGSDIESAAKDPHLLEIIKSYNLTHVSNALWLVDELKSLGIESAYLPVAAEDFAGDPVRRVLTPFEQFLERTLEGVPAQPSQTRASKVAISGLHLFAAQISSQVRKMPSHWEPTIVRTRERLEVVTALFAIAACDVWYSIGSPVGDRWTHLFARLLRKPRVIHWVGSDVQGLYSNPRLRKLCARKNVINLAEVDWTIDELAQVGITASLAPLPPHFKATPTVKPLPGTFTVMLYVPKTRGDFYGRREFERLFRAFSDKPVRFIVVGGGRCSAPPGCNVLHLGWCSDLTEVYGDSTVLLRLTQHDGLSIMVLEALACGRRVLWTQDFPFVTQVKNYDDCCRELTGLLEEHLRGSLAPQTDIAQIVTETYSSERCVANIERSWDEARGVKRIAQALARAPL